MVLAAAVLFFSSVFFFSSTLAFGQDAAVDIKVQPKTPTPARAAASSPPPIAR